MRWMIPLLLVVGLVAFSGQAAALHCYKKLDDDECRVSLRDPTEPSIKEGCTDWRGEVDGVAAATVCTVNEITDPGDGPDIEW